MILCKPVNCLMGIGFQNFRILLPDSRSPRGRTNMMKTEFSCEACGVSEQGVDRLTEKPRRAERQVKDRHGKLPVI